MTSHPDQPLISVITPVFNNVQYIENCIRNVIEQSCSEVEHIIVDGGSTDGTLSIIERYATDYSHIKWISEKDNGQSDAMNKGIKMAESHWVGFLNVDDFYEPHVLNRVCQIARQSLQFPALLVGKLRTINAEGKVLRIRRPNPIVLKNVLAFWELESFPANPSSYFYHKKLHEKIGYYDLDQPYTMDYEFFLRACQVVNVYYYDEIWGNFRIIPGAKTFEIGQNGSTKKIKEKLFFRYLNRLPLTERIIIFIRYLMKYKKDVWKKRIRYFYNK